MRTLLVSAFVLGMPSAAALACGTVQMWTDAYWEPTATDQRRQSVLTQLTVLCGSNTDADGDRRLLAVLRDAEHRQYDKALLRRVLETHRCLRSVPPAEGVAQMVSATGARCR